MGQDRSQVELLHTGTEEGVTALQQHLEKHVKMFFTEAPENLCWTCLWRMLLQTALSNLIVRDEHPGKVFTAVMMMAMVDYCYDMILKDDYKIENPDGTSMDAKVFRNNKPH